jgi:hypothetical protein
VPGASPAREEAAVSLDRVLDYASDIGASVTWGETGNGKHWVRLHPAAGQIRVGYGRSREDAADALRDQIVKK